MAQARETFSHAAPHPGWGEQDLLDWWTATAAAIGRACRQIDTTPLAAMAITHQRETFACLDRARNALRPAILWLDTRATDQVARNGSEHAHRVTGKPPNTATRWYMLRWLREHEPRTLDATAHVVDVHAYLVNRLNVEWASSWGSVDPLGVLDMQRFALHDGLIGALGLPLAAFPEVQAPETELGRLRQNVAAQLGLPAGLPVMAGLAAGLYLDIPVAAAMTGTGRSHHPDPLQSARCARLYGVNRDLYPACASISPVSRR